MIKKVEIVVEQFDNGITLRWKDVEGNVSPENQIVLEGQEERSIGHMLWKDIFEYFDKMISDKVKISVEYDKA